MDILMDDVGTSRAPPPGEAGRPLLVLNLETKDNHEAAALAGGLALRLAQALEAGAGPGGGWEEGLDAAVSTFEAETQRRLSYAIAWVA
jgi:hypothetical protein